MRRWHRKLSSSGSSPFFRTERVPPFVHLYQVLSSDFWERLIDSRLLCECLLLIATGDSDLKVNGSLNVFGRKESKSRRSFALMTKKKRELIDCR
ncbi:hypothetical protein CEXT_42241 [Caerostris extrusa]|uniref:Uncharacterized protein n=1 Tax=Caerostris extrusa TaxID=172846 RepID=A0AAV4PU30_CAEEX|nr:hypothetical protein CEXT_42241 [Caerostris extrusa]